MQQMYYCPRCSVPVAYGSRFCGYCGNQLYWQQQVPPYYQWQPPYYQQQPPHFQQQQWNYQQQQYYQQQYGFTGQQLKGEKVNTWLIVLGSVIALLVLIAVVAGVSGGKSSSFSSTDKKIPSAIEMNAAQLYQEYNANQVAADAKYKGKILSVSGTVNDVGIDIIDTPYVMLGTEQLLSAVQCMFSKQDESMLAQLSKGQSLRIQGKCDGLGIISVMLSNCLIQK
jgi:hypothetical protein